jgi:hypothetical protein
MRESLLFYGIPEVEENGSWTSSDVIDDFCACNLHVGVENLYPSIDRPHRVGSKSSRTQPIVHVVKFNDYNIREYIQSQRGQLSQLRGTSFWIKEQFPKEINDHRKDHEKRENSDYPFYKQKAVRV